MNILFIHEVDWLDKVVFDMHSLAEALSVRGHNVFAVDYENTWRKNGFFDFGSLKTKRIDNISRALAGSSVKLHRPGFIKIPGLSRLSVAVTSHREIKRIIKQENIDAILLYSVPTTGLQTVSIAGKLGVPVIFRSIDILNQLVTSPALRPFTRYLEREVYSMSDRILTLTPSLSEYVIGLGADESKVSLLLMPVDTKIFHPLPVSDELRLKWGLAENNHVLLFMGTLFDFSGLEKFIPTFNNVVHKVPGTKLLIVGDGPQRAMLEELISKYKLENDVIITGFEPYEMMPQYINLSSICVNTFKITDATRDIFPGKTVQFLACGKPFVATALPGMKAVIAGEEQGIVYVYDHEEMTESVISLLNSETRREGLGKAGLEYVIRVHSYDSIVRQLEEIIDTIVSKKVVR